MELGLDICYWANGEVVNDEKTGVTAGKVGEEGSETTRELAHGREKRQTRKM